MRNLFSHNLTESPSFASAFLQSKKPILLVSKKWFLQPKTAIFCNFLKYPSVYLLLSFIGELLISRNTKRRPSKKYVLSKLQRGSSMIFFSSCVPFWSVTFSNFSKLWLSFYALSYYSYLGFFGDIFEISDTFSKNSDKVLTLIVHKKMHEELKSLTMCFREMQEI